MRDIVATIQADQYRLITREPGPSARDPGWAGNRQDGRRPPPCLVADLHRAGEECAQPRARRRAEPDVHGVRLARAARPRRGERGAARGRRARRRRRADAARPARRRAAEGGHAAGRRDRAAQPSCGSPPSPRSSDPARGRVHPGAARASCAAARGDPRGSTGRPRPPASASGWGSLRRFYEEYGRRPAGRRDPQTASEVEKALAGERLPRPRARRRAWPVGDAGEARALAAHDAGASSPRPPTGSSTRTSRSCCAGAARAGRTGRAAARRGARAASASRRAPTAT